MWGTLDDVLEELLDHEGVEVDPLDRLEADSPLHKAVRYVNALRAEEWAGAAPLVELLVEAGADVRYVVVDLSLPVAAETEKHPPCSPPHSSHEACG